MSSSDNFVITLGEGPTDPAAIATDIGLESSILALADQDILYYVAAEAIWKNVPFATLFNAEPHTHLEAQITDIDKYTQSQVDALVIANNTAINTAISLKSDSDHTHDLAYATLAQGALADTALQATNNISLLTNDSAFISDYIVLEADVTAHQAAISITESQISDLGIYMTADVSGTITNKIINDPTNTVHADATHRKVKNNTGSSIINGSAVKSIGYNLGDDATDIALADQATDVAIGIVEGDIAHGSEGMIIVSGVIESVDTSAFVDDEILYVNGLGALTNIRPLTGFAQPIAYVLRSHSTVGVLQVLAGYPLQSADDVRLTSGSFTASNVQAAFEEVHTSRVLADTTFSTHNSDSTIHYTVGSIVLPQSQVTDLTTALAARELLTSKNTVNGYAGLDALGKLDPDQLPALATTETYPVIDQAAMLALGTIQTGDVAVITVEPAQSWINVTGGNGALSDWVQLLFPTDAILSVAGKTTSNIVLYEADITGGIDKYTVAAVDALIADFITIAHTHNLSALTNDSGFITGYTVTEGDVTAHQGAISINKAQIPDFGDYVPLSGPVPINGELILTGDYTETSINLGVADGTVLSCDLDTGTYFYITDVTAATTIGFTGQGATGRVSSFTLEITNALAFALTFSATIKWEGGTAPAWTAGLAVVSFLTRDGGATWLGFTGGLDLS